MTRSTALAAFAAVHIGKKKKENQDRFLLRVEPGRPALLAVADGMGGERGGERAAEIACAVLDEGLSSVSEKQTADALAALMRRAVLAAHEAVCLEAASVPELRYMGATLTALLALGTTAAFGHVGDSSLFRLREGRLERLTQDHRFLTELIEAGDISEEEAACHPLRRQLDMALGTPGCDPQCEVFDLRPGDRLLLCSDGLTDEITKSDLAAELLLCHSPEKTVHDLIQAALARGGRDNITVLVADALLAP